MNSSGFGTRCRLAIAAACLLTPAISNAAITSPADVAGLRLWLDADDSSSLTVTGGKVSGWTDKSGSGNSVSQADANVQPSYAAAGGPGNSAEVVFGASGATSIGDQFVSNTSGNVQNSFTAFFLVRTTKAITTYAESTTGAPGTSGESYVWAPDFVSGGSRGAGLSLGTNAAAVYEHTDATLTPVASKTFASPLSDYHVLAVRYSSGSPSLYLDGALIETGLTSGATILATKQFGDVGSGGTSTGFGFFQGGLNEALVYNSALTLGSGGDFENVNNYLAAQVPEPGTLAVAGISIAGLLVRRRRNV